ncbi:MerR family transcriptional regulator [Ralstonia insidiosa]|nr:MerR family transcriptional regulator [Ralstonia insidiosa]
MLLKDDSSMKSLYTFLQIKKHEIQQSITDKENKVCKIEQIQRYVHQNSISPIYYLQDIATYMEESHRLKGVRKKLWLSIALIGSLQYGGLITSIVTQRKKPFLSMMPVVAMYSLWLTKKYKKNVSYVCPNCHHVFNPSVIHFVTASHTPKTRKLQCPDCHEMHYCVEIAKQ